MMDQFNKTILKRGLEIGSYVEALLEFQHINKVDDIEDLVPLIDKIIKEKITFECREKNLLKEPRKKNKLKKLFDEESVQTKEAKNG